MSKSCIQDRAWANKAIGKIEAENNRSADTHLYAVPLPEHWGVQLYLKDESTHRSGSLKHRLARSLFLYGMVNGWITEGTTIVEASSGSTAVSEAYFARLLGLPYIAVMTRTTSPEKIALIEDFGGSCLFVDHASEVYAVAEETARTAGGHYMDQFTYAERATDWRGQQQHRRINLRAARPGRTPCARSGSSWAPAPAEPAPPSAATCGTTAIAPGSLLWIRKTPRSIPAWRDGDADAVHAACRRGSKASDGRASSQASSRRSSTT